MLSDYDIEVYVRDTGPIVANDDWLRDFGPIMVRWPLTPRPTASQDWVTQLVLFEDGLRIDFQITPKQSVTAKDYDNGYAVLVDKDGLGASLGTPTYSEFALTPPTRLAYEETINSFWWDIIYVAKELWRGELNFAKFMLDSVVRFEQLQPLIEWYIGLTQGPDAMTGVNGRWFQRRLDPETWRQYEATFADADIENNWAALFATLSFARRIGQALAESMGYTYPEAVDQKVTRYIESIRQLPK